MSLTKSVLNLSIVICLLMIVQSLAGFIFGSIYRDSIIGLCTWKGNDLVTLFVASPILIISIVYSYKNLAWAKYLLFSMLFYSFYNYSYYVFGAMINVFYIHNILIFTLSGCAILILISKIDIEILNRDFRQIKSAKFISIYIMLFSLLIGAMWISQWLVFVINGTAPSLLGTEEAYRLVAGMDLTIQVPCLAIASILLWKNRPIGYLLGFILMVADAIYMLVLMAYSPYANNAGIQDAWSFFPLWTVLCIGCSISSIIFLKNFNTRQ